MKKFMVPLLLASVLVLCSCNLEKAATNISTVTPTATASATQKPKATPQPDAQNTPEPAKPQEAQTLYIINGMSSPIYGLYLTASKEGNPGDNILGDTPLSEGEEIGIPYVYDSEEQLYIIIEDEGGNTTSTDAFTLEDGLNIELREEDGKLKAVVQ